MTTIKMKKSFIFLLFVCFFGCVKQEIPETTNPTPDVPIVEAPTPIQTPEPGQEELNPTPPVVSDDPTPEQEPEPDSKPVLTPEPTPAPRTLSDLYWESVEYQEPYIRAIYGNKGKEVLPRSFSLKVTKDGVEMFTKTIEVTDAPSFGEKREIKIHLDELNRPTGRTISLGLTLDKENFVEEEIEDNNVSTTLLAIPNLVLPEFRALSLIYEGNSVTYSYQFTRLPSAYFNGKTFSIGLWAGEELQYQISNRPADRYDAVQVIVGVPIPNHTEIISQTMPIPQAFDVFRGREYRFALLLDHRYEIFESYRQDNWIEAPYFLNPLPGQSSDEMPDLAMVSAYLTMNNTYLSISVRNSGADVTVGSGTRYKIKIERCGGSYTFDAGQIPLGDIVTFAHSTSLMPGLGQNCNTRFIVDPENLLSEPNEMNNVFNFGPLFLPHPNGTVYPDLQLHTLWIQQSPSYISLTVYYLVPHMQASVPVRFRMERCGYTVYSRYTILLPGMNTFGLGLYEDELPARRRSCLTTITLDPDNNMRERDETNNGTTGDYYFY